MSSWPPAPASAPRERSASARRAWSSDETHSTHPMIAAHRRVYRSTSPRLPVSQDRLTHGPGSNDRRRGHLQIPQAASSKRTVLGPGRSIAQRVAPQARTAGGAGCAARHGASSSTIDRAGDAGGRRRRRLGRARAVPSARRAVSAHARRSRLKRDNGHNPIQYIASTARPISTTPISLGRSQIGELMKCPG